MKDANCEFCNAGAPNLQGICTDCDSCFGEHCQCDPCQHGKARSEECVFCGRGFKPLVEAIVETEDEKLKRNLLWLQGSEV